MNDSRKALVLLSGGLDSTACLDFYLNKGYEVQALYINYGQLAFSKEHQAVKSICKHFSVGFDMITIESLKAHKDGFVIGRNMFLLSTALIQADINSGFIAMGLHFGTNYSDCSESFVEKMKALFDLYSNGKIQIGVPFISWTKREIWEYSKLRNIPIELTYSCELGLTQPCNKCASCKDLIKLHAS